ncbi:hypothetical protein B0J15DRAFT_225009 [Fusarium solani]|uniref:Uncharacterized protein n=1 Tax=Fusarium solani TaxID=169388 RepID=A0A9P9L0Q1_FUSSL|nr:uncharacterized protein B0J15DRAFT_225009 [Fusarium solani]KAH7271848.1 hypothetical protein B0J15DRAFT_225009 [Fusarium solani]
MLQTIKDEDISGPRRHAAISAAFRRPLRLRSTHLSVGAWSWHGRGKTSFLQDSPATQMSSPPWRKYTRCGRSWFLSASWGTLRQARFAPGAICRVPRCKKESATTVPDGTSSEILTASDVMGVVKLFCPGDGCTPFPTKTLVMKQFETQTRFAFPFWAAAPSSVVHHPTSAFYREHYPPPHSIKWLDHVCLCLSPREVSYYLLEAATSCSACWIM